MLKDETRGLNANVRPVAFAVPVKDCVSELLTPHTCESQVLEAYGPFIHGGSVSLLGSDVEVPINILRDTGAYSSYIVDSILSFSRDTFTGLSVFPVALHKIVLNCQLVQGVVVVGVRRALPIEGIHLNLGNGLHNRLLVRKWVPVSEDGVKKDVFQIVVPKKVSFPSGTW